MELYGSKKRKVETGLEGNHELPSWSSCEDDELWFIYDDFYLYSLNLETMSSTRLLNFNDIVGDETMPGLSFDQWSLNCER